MSATEYVWTEDGTAESSLDALDGGRKLSVASASRGTPFNFMMDSKSTSTCVFFETSIIEIEGSIGVGLVQRSEFFPGWKLAGMFYNGHNITNGSEALIIGYDEDGGKLSAGDTVGVWMKQEPGDGTTVAFYRNGLCLGKAFHLSKDNTVYHPCLHVTGRAVISYDEPPNLPRTMDREQPPSCADEFLGKWKLVGAFKGPDAVDLPLPNSDVIFKFSPAGGGDAYHLSVKAGNTLGSSVNVTGKIDEGFSSIQIGGIRSTRMGVGGPMGELENYLLSSLKSLHKMITGENNDLVMIGPTTKYICSRHHATFKPLKAYNE